jgi:replication-associated recombination protein RarA
MGESDRKRPPVRFSELPTPGGYLCGEVTSALQKAIRRGNEREALFWASELDLAGYANYVWKRLRIIASEDVGLADPEAVLLTRVLYDNWSEHKKATKESEPLFLIHAVIVLARAQKSGVTVHAWMAFYEGDRQAMGMQIPDHALDMHTARGRRMGRGKQHFLDEAGRLENETLPDPYREEGAVAWTRSKTKRKQEPPASEPPGDQLELG